MGLHGKYDGRRYAQAMVVLANGQVLAAGGLSGVSAIVAALIFILRSTGGFDVSKSTERGRKNPAPFLLAETREIWRNEEALRELRRGWVLGGEAFRDRVLDWMEKNRARQGERCGGKKPTMTTESGTRKGSSAKC